MNEQSKRAKARWAILRNALLSSSSQHSQHLNATTAECNTGSNDYHNENKNIDYSIHRFKGFHLLKRKVLCKDEIISLSNSDDKISSHDKDYVMNKDPFEQVEYEIPLTKPQHCNNPILLEKNQEVLKIRIKEKKQNVKQKWDMKELMSHQHYGVDNTGNTRVWECSMILAYLLISSSIEPLKNIPNNAALHESPQLSLKSGKTQLKDKSKTCEYLALSNLLNLASPKPQEQSEKENKNSISEKRLRVIELGAGMAAIPALSLSALKLNQELSSPSLNHAKKLPFMDIIITDGHPNSVKNNIDCSKLTLDSYYAKYEETKDEKKVILRSNHCSIQTQLLLWKANSEGARECEELLYGGHHDNRNKCPNYFDVIFVSDCIHFTEFQASLMASIGRLLRVGGVCLLCQPKRGRSLDLFIDLINEVNNYGEQSKPLFESTIHHDYDEEITKQHRENEQKNTLYDPDIHYPVIMTLKKLRNYNEDIDSHVASAQVERRNNS